MADSNPKPKPSSVSNLLCQEDKSYLVDENQDKPKPSSSNLIINPHFYPIDDGDDDDYVRILVYKERNSPVFLYNYPPYLKDFRVHAVDWILNAQKTFGLKNQTAYLSLIYMDRFLSRKLISENQRWVVDLLSIASLSLATKMDESNVRPSFADYQRLVEDYTFADSVIQDMELAVLNCLEWRMNLNTPFVFINYFIKELGDQHTNHDELISRANDLIMALIKECNSMDDYGPFVVAGAAVLAAFNWQSSEQDLKVKISTVSLWEISDNQQQKQQQEEELIGCYKILQRLCNNANPSTPYTEVELRATTPTRLAGTKRNLSFRDIHQHPDLPD